VVAHDWATWHLNNQPQTATRQSLNGPCAFHLSNAVLPCQPATCLPPYLPNQLLTSSGATCHPYSGDTCHPWIGPVVCPYAISACHVSPPRAATSSVQTVRPVQLSCHVALYGLYSHPLFLPVCLFGQNTIYSVYEARLTK
jgi:hypothetical protein